MLKHETKNDIFFAIFISRGGLLRRVKAELMDNTKSAFDVLYVVDSRRSWYTERNKVGKSRQCVVKHYEQHVQMPRGQYLYTKGCLYITLYN